MDIKGMLEKIVKAAKRSYQIDESMSALGYDCTPYADIYGDLWDAIYLLLGEQKDTFADSVTYHTLMNPELTESQCVDILYQEYEKSVANAYIDGMMTK